jgi:site-specific DNA-methyltransferase (adenine-specific)
MKGYAASKDTSSDWTAKMRDWLTEMHKILKPGGRLALNIPLDTTKGGFRPTYAQAVQIAVGVGFTYRATIVWNEGNVNKSTARGSVDSAGCPHIIAPVEMVALFSKGDWRRDPPNGGDLDHQDWLDWTNGLWTFGGESQSWEGHPAAFPEELPRRLVKLLSFPGDTVLDPFNGSGTTTLVAYRLSRKAVGFDASAEYVESARRRMILSE